MRRNAFILIALGALVAGCGPGIDPKMKFDDTLDGQFIIDGTDFGIDPDGSSFEIDTTDPNKPLMTIEIRGQADVAQHDYDFAIRWRK